MVKLTSDPGMTFNIWPPPLPKENKNMLIREVQRKEENSSDATSAILCIFMALGATEESKIKISRFLRFIYDKGRFFAFLSRGVELFYTYSYVCGADSTGLNIPYSGRATKKRTFYMRLPLLSWAIHFVCYCPQIS